jgi:O-antigen/teichoic acid export membrane protein
VAGELSTEAPLSSRIAGSAMGLAGRRVAMTLLSGLSTAIVARLLGPAGYGQLASALATWTLILAASDFGFTLALGRDLATRIPQRGRLLRSAFELQSLWSVLLALMMALVALASSLDSTRGQVLLVLAPSVAFAGLGGARQVFTVLYSQRTVVLIDLAVIVVQVALMIVAAAAGLGAIAVAAVICCCYILNAVLVAIAAVRLMRTERPEPGMRRWLLARVAPLGLMAFLSTAYLTVDLVLLGWLVSGSSLGDYAAASKILLLLATLPGILVGAALPGFASHVANGRDLEGLAARVWHWLMVVAAPAFVAVCLFAPTVITLTVGSKYHGAIQLLRVLTLAGMIGVASMFFGTILIAKSVVRPLLAQNAVALLVNVVGNLLLVPRVGVIASAWLTVATEAIVCIGALLLLRRDFDIRRMAGVSGRPVVALAAVVVVGIALNGLPAIGIPACAIVFLAVLLTLGAWPAEFVPRRAAPRRA